jgi:hypothetical protein
VVVVAVVVVVVVVVVTCLISAYLFARHHGFTARCTLSPNPIGMANAKEPSRRHIPKANVDASGTLFPLSWLHSMDPTWSGGWKGYDP